MRMEQVLNKNTKGIVAAIAVLIILFPLGYSVVRSVFAGSTDGSGPFVEKPAQEHGTQCLLETTYEVDARFHHMDLLKRIREDAVREGARGEIGLSDCRNNCRDCHTSRERFCDRCHKAVNLHLNCVRCHYYP